MSREAFEAAYAAHMNESRDDGETSDAADIAKLRDGDWYGVRRSYLNGCWKGWQLARAAALEEAASAAFNHFVDVCRERKVDQDFVRVWCSSDAIRTLKEKE